MLIPPTKCGPGSAVGIATDYGLDGPGIESQWGARFSARPDRPWGPPSLLYDGYRVFPEGKVRGQGVLLTTDPLLVPRSWKSRAILLPPPPLGHNRVCNGVTLPLPPSKHKMSLGDHFSLAENILSVCKVTVTLHQELTSFREYLNRLTL